MSCRVMGSQYDPTSPRAIVNNARRAPRVTVPVRYRGGGLSGFAGAVAAVPESVKRDAVKAGFLAVVIPVKAPAAKLSGLGITPATQSSLIGAASSLVKTKNPTVSYAAQGASVGASIGSVVPVIGTVIGAAIGAVVGAIGGAFKGTRRPESDFWDDYKDNHAGKHRGIEYDNQYRNSAFVGLFRLRKNTFPPRAKGGYGPNDDARFLDDMAAQIAAAVRAGKVGAEDDQNSIFAKIVGPWIAQWGTEGNAQWKNWEDQIVKDQIEAYIFDQPIVATSYTESRKANPSIAEVVASLPTAAPAAPAATVAPPQAYQPTPGGGVQPIIPPAPTQSQYPPGSASNPPGVPQSYWYMGRDPATGQLLFRASPTNTETFIYDSVHQRLVPYNPSAPPNYTPPPVTALPYPPLPTTTAPPANVPAPVVTPTNTGPQVDVQGLINTLLQQGVSNQDAFMSAMRSLQSQGVAPTPAVQTQVAEQVKSASSALPPWALPVGIAAGVGVIVFIFARRRGRRTH